MKIKQWRKEKGEELYLHFELIFIVLVVYQVCVLLLRQAPVFLWLLLTPQSHLACFYFYLLIYIYIPDGMMSQGWRSTRPHPDSWSTSRSHYWPACWAGLASCAWHWSCCWGPPVSSTTRGTGVADRRRMVKRPSLQRFRRHSL